jgi:threonine dehydratase
MTDARLPTAADLEAARERIRPEAVRTPLISSPTLDALIGGRVFLKPENLQRTGSFKFRGAFNAVSRLAAAGVKSVVASSSGNHAQGVAEAARLLGLSATIVMPADAPAIKVARTRAMGATVIPYDRMTEDREAIAVAVAAEQNASIVHPYENADVMAGQGTIGLEVADDLDAKGLNADQLLVCCGGGGMTAGIALALEARSPSTALYTVEPAGFDDQARSFRAGERLKNPAASGSVCDALMAPTPGEMTFAVNRSRVRAGLVVTDQQALSAVAFAARELKLVVEPGGAVALAAVLHGVIDLKGKVTVAILSGGNIDPAMLERALAA